MAKRKRTLIAVVDDDPLVRDALASLMRSLGYTVRTFASAEDFLGSTRRGSASCIIADVRMPGMTGPELNDHLVASGETVPVILITAFPEEATRVRALQAGVTCVLTKPVSKQELLECLHSALGA